MKTKCCDKCNKEIVAPNFNRHYKACGTKVESKIKVDETWKQENGLYKCPYCGKEYSKSGISTHIWRMHGDGIDHNYKLKERKISSLRGKTYAEIYW